jgi:hypothetical protein
MIGKSMRSDDNFGSVLHRRHTTVNISGYGNPIEVRSGALRGCRWAWFLASAVGRPPSLTPHQRREAMERLAQGAAQAELARSYGVSLRPALSRQARSAREEAEVNETWQLVSGIAADW